MNKNNNKSLGYPKLFVVAFVLLTYFLFPINIQSHPQPS